MGRKPQLDLSESEREGVMHVLKCIFPILCLASAAPELGTVGNDRLLQNLVDTLVGKVSNFANQIFTIAAFAHESFSKPSSSLPAYNNSAYQQQGKVVELGSGLRIYTWARGLTVHVLSGTMTSRALMVAGQGRGATSLPWRDSWSSCRTTTTGQKHKNVLLQTSFAGWV